MDSHEHLPALPPVKRDTELVAMHGDDGRLMLVDPSVPDGLTVADVLGEHSGIIPMDVQVDGGDAFSVEPDGTISGIDQHGHKKVYDRDSGTWVSPEEH
jgi:hypothetical protein